MFPLWLYFNRKEEMTGLEIHRVWFRKKAIKWLNRPCICPRVCGKNFYSSDGPV